MDFEPRQEHLLLYANYVRAFAPLPTPGEQRYSVQQLLAGRVENRATAQTLPKVVPLRIVRRRFLELYDSRPERLRHD